MGAKLLYIHSIDQALAPYPQAGCCTVTGLAPRVLFMEFMRFFCADVSISHDFSKVNYFNDFFEGESPATSRPVSAY